MQTSIYFEFERPIGWHGEVVDLEASTVELDYFDLEVEADATIEIDNHFGADADGNRGISMVFSYVEDITVNFDVAGDAQGGVDYSLTASPVTIPALDLSLCLKTI